MDEVDRLIGRSVEAAVEAEGVPPRALEKAKALMRETLFCPHCGKRITPFKRPRVRQAAWSAVYLAGAVVSFGLSFVIGRYFFQFLVLTLLFGFKWVLEQRAMKTQVLIYKALREEEGTELRSKDLHQHLSRL